MKTIKTICPVCNNKIEDENIIPEKDYAFCTVCQKDFSFTDFFVVPDTEKQETTEVFRNYQPPRTWIYEKPNEIIIGAVARNIVIGFIFFIFVIICVTFAIGIVFYNADGFKVSNIFWAIILLFFSSPLVVFGLIFLIDKVEFVIGKESYIYEQQGIWGGKTEFDWSSVVKIYEKTIKVSKKRETFIIIKLAEKTVKKSNGKLTNEISFGTALTKKQRQFLLNTLQYYHNKKL